MGTFTNTLILRPLHKVLILNSATGWAVLTSSASSLKGVFWQDDEDVVLPLPLDCQVVAEDGGEQALPLAPTWETKHRMGFDWQEYRLYGRFSKIKQSGTGLCLPPGFRASFDNRAIHYLRLPSEQMVDKGA